MAKSGQYGVDPLGLRNSQIFHLEGWPGDPYIQKKQGQNKDGAGFPHRILAQKRGDYWAMRLENRDEVALVPSLPMGNIDEIREIYEKLRSSLHDQGCALTMKIEA